MNQTLLLVAIGVAAVVSAGAAPAASKPDPYRQQATPWIGPAPVPVMEQVFWVQLAVAPGTELQVTAPEGVALLDQTKPGTSRPFTRLYFRSDRGVAEGEIRITGGGQSWQVPLRVLTYREDITEKVKVIKTWSPEARKRGRSYYTPEIVALAQHNLASSPDLAKQLRAATVFDKLSDAELFAWLPSWNLPRQCYSDWPCPKCGEQVFEKSGFYPWQHGDRHSFKCKCPVCGQTFPSNDVTQDDFTSGPYPDDGWGYDWGGKQQRVAHAGWVGYHNHHMMWQSTGGALKQLGERYLLGGDESAAHIAGVLLARLAYIYPGMDMSWQQVKPGYLRSGRLLLDGPWERWDVLTRAAQAYDAIFDYVDRDTKLAAFLHTKDPAINTPQDVKRLIELYLIQVFGADWLDRRLPGGSQGAREADMAAFAVCADMGEVSDRWLQELFTHAFNSGLDKGGVDDENFVNLLSRDGITVVNGFGYANVYLRTKSNLAEWLSGIKTGPWARRANLYDEALYPKFRAEFDTWTEMLAAGKWAPTYGDDGNARGSQIPQGMAAHSRREFTRAYRRWPSDNLARALYAAGPAPPVLTEPDVWPQVEGQVKRVGPARPLGSRVLDGVGFVFLEARPTAEKPAQRAAIALRYGYGYGHHHHDNLNLELWAHDVPLAPDLGYPCWTHPLGATGSTVHHNTGMIDRTTQYSGATGRGALEQFAAAPEASFAELSSRPTSTPDRAYRRAVCLAEAPDGNTYALDVLRLTGGKVRTYCAHGPASREFASSLEFGTARSEPFELIGMSRSLKNNVLEPREAGSDGDVWFDWTHDQTPTHLRLSVLGHAGRRYATARFGKTDSPPIRFFFPEDEAPDGRSEFVALWQPYQGQPFIEKIERLPVTADKPAGEFAPVVVRITLRGGQVDTFFYTDSPGGTIAAEGFEFAGSFGYWSEQGGKLRCLHLVNGRRLLKGGVGVTDAPPAYTAKVTAVDPAANVLTLDQKLPAGETPAGQMLYLTGGPHRSAYRLLEVRDGGQAVKLEQTGLLFRSKVMAFSEDRKTVTTELPPPLETSKGFPPGYYDGVLVTGEDHRARYRVQKVEGDKVVLDRPAAEADFPDADGDGRRMLQLFEHGPGDEVRLPHAVFIRVQEGKVEQHGVGSRQGL